MKKTYILPDIDLQQLTSAEQLLTSSIKVGGKVENTNDVGFVKGNVNTNGNEEFWDNEKDW